MNPRDGAFPSNGEACCIVGRLIPLAVLWPPWKVLPKPTSLGMGPTLAPLVVSVARMGAVSFPRIRKGF